TFFVEIKYCLNCGKIFVEGKKCSICGQNFTLMDENFLIGKELGKYKIESFIGEGGMGAVFKGIHTTLKKQVAIKVLIPSGSETSFSKRFKKEAEIMAFLKHPNIVEIYDYDISEMGFPYIVMEYLEGHSLREEILRNPQGLPFQTIKNYLKQIVSGLSHAHKKGVVHRDLKPENIFISFLEDQKIVKILDFGIAKLLFPTEETQVLTKTNTVVGTPQYLSPEQIMGKEITPKSDQYSLALILYEMMTGKAVREGKTFGEIVSSISTEKIELEKFELGDFGKKLSEPLKKAAEKNPSKRFEDIEQFAKAVLPDTEIIDEKPTTQMVLKGPKKNLKIYPFFIIFLTLSLIISLFFIKFSSKKQDEPFSLIGEYKIPTDLGSLLSFNEFFMVFEGKDCMYFYEENLSNQPLKVSIQKGDKILGSTEEGKILILKGNSVYLRQYLNEDKMEEKETFFIKNFPEYERVSFSPDLNFFALEDKNTLKVFKIFKDYLEEIYSLDLKDKRFKGFKCGKNYLAFVVEDFLYIFDLRKGQELHKIPVDTSNFYSMAFFEESGLFALGGWFDGIYIFDLKEGKKKYFTSLGGKTNSLSFLKNFPSLLISKGDSVLVWKFKENIFLKYQNTEKEFLYSVFTPFGIVSREERENKLYLFSIKDFSTLKSFKTGEREIWGMDYLKGGDFLYAGSSIGNLYVLNIKKDKIKEFKLHTQGITSILCFKENLITASDDKTITVWKIPDMKVSYRTEAHNWLINYIYLNESTQTLWTSSSDGFVKAFSFPGLKILEELKTGPYSNAALWVDALEEEMAVGTWNNLFLYFQKKDREWLLDKSYKIPSQAIYSLSFLPKEKILFMAGINPYKIYLFFLKDKKLYEMSIENSGINWVVLKDEKSIYAAGNCCLYSISIDRGAKRATVSTLLNTDLKICPVSTFLRDKNVFATGTSKGDIFLINLNEIKFPEGYIIPIEREILPE
ncbi:MAG: serine/threonine-protein kinase, partial [Thermoanaerobaculia bacterium]